LCQLEVIFKNEPSNADVIRVLQKKKLTFRITSVRELSSED
jgi:hypothetical protein